MDSRYCPRCERDVPLDGYYRGSERGRVQAYCIPCTKVKQREHYARQVAKHPNGFDPMARKVCTVCTVEKPAAEFYLFRRAVTGLTSACKICTGRQTQARKFGLTVDEVIRLAKACGICGATDDLVFDHCHVSGELRDVLCRRCNLGLGYFDDDPERMRRAGEYIERFAAREAVAV